MKKGFSLLELVIITFIGISLIALAAGLYGRSRGLSRTMVCMNNLRQMSMAVENYQSDWRHVPVNLYDLFPRYVKTKGLFECPEDKTSVATNLPNPNSYDNYYLSRSFAEEDTNKLFLFCPRHFSYGKGVAGFLSYATSIVDNMPVTWNDKPILPQPQQTGYSTGTFRFADGSTAAVTSAAGGYEVRFFGSFRGPDGRIYSLLYLPENVPAGASGTVTLDHQGDSRFEIVTPAVIAGVSGTKYNISTQYLSNNQTITTITVLSGTVLAEERETGSEEKITASNNNWHSRINKYRNRWKWYH